ncbi:MAG: Eco57I restriction-modification methylase domain-containing protein, partial [Candidatus Hermodarchaeota archaeon]
FFNFKCINTESFFSDRFALNKWKELLSKNPSIKNKLQDKIKTFKILDPACGSGRFLVSAARYLFKICKTLELNSNDHDLKRYIVENMIYGVDIDNSACLISQIRLILWIYADTKDLSLKSSIKNSNILNANMEQIINKTNIEMNIFNVDFLLEFTPNKTFDFIVGNPPYIENKKISDLKFKKELQKKFTSAYKLFDLSVVFIEKSLALLKKDEGFLAFLATNKFLAADYGVKIRDLLLKTIELKEISNVSALPIFTGISSYPIIIFLKNIKPTKKSKFKIKDYTAINELVENLKVNTKEIEQEVLNILPSNVIPIYGNIKLMKYLYSNYQLMSESINDLRIIYRPYGFTKWKNFFKNIKTKYANKDLMLIGTGNVGQYHIQFNKRIRIAKNDLDISYFSYLPEFEDKWNVLNNEKLIFREIAKNLTVAYDPGIFTNITGLYFISIPSFNTNDLFSLMAILNSNLMNQIFNSLFGTLHMSGNYLRYNASFIKRLPMPEDFPNSLAYLGKINQFLSQLLYDSKVLSLNWEELQVYQVFFKKITDKLVYLLYLQKCNDKLAQDFTRINKKLSLNLFDFKFGYILNSYHHPKLKFYSEKEFSSIINGIKDLYFTLKKMLT